MLILSKDKRNLSANKSREVEIICISWRVIFSHLFGFFCFASISFYLFYLWKKNEKSSRETETGKKLFEKNKIKMIEKKNPKRFAQ